MGQPFDKRYKDNSRLYLKFEEEAVKEIINNIENLKNGTKIVVDTTGSLIYLNKKILKELKKYSKFIYLDITTEVKKSMYNNYLKNPKPVYWGSSFRLKNGESPQSALSQCYPDLLEYRIRKYKKYADITLDYNRVRINYFSAKDLINV